MKFSTVETAVEAIRLGQMVVVLDDEARENEADLVLAGQKVSPEAITFMAKKASGLICLALASEQVSNLDLAPMVKHNRDTFGTAFTMSIDASQGISTGISAADRAKTIFTASNPATKPCELVSPGHVFPLCAREGGVLARPGHTEAAVDLARLAGLWPAGVICEIMGNDGQMLRDKALARFIKRHGLVCINIAQLIAYQRRAKTALEFNRQPKTATTLPTVYGNFKIYQFETEQSSEPHLALILGEVKPGDCPLVRIHSECLTGDIFGSLRCDCGEQLDLAMKKISAEGSGIIVYLRQEGRGLGLSKKLQAYALQDKGLDTVEANQALGFPADMRDYQVAISILESLQIKQLRLMTNNPAKLQAIRETRFTRVERIPLRIKPNANNYHYLRTKYLKLQHFLEGIL